MEVSEYERMARVEDRHWWFQGRLAVVKAILRRYVPPGLGLDCSCGAGLTLASLPVWVQVGADLHPAALRACRTRGLRRLIQADLRKLPVSDGALDLATCLDTLEHIEEDRKALAEIYRVLKPGGYAVFTVPAHPWMYSAHDRALHHVRRYRRTELRDRIANTGFNILKCRYINGALFPAIALARLISRGRGASSDTDSIPPRPVNWLLYQLFALERVGWLNLPWGVSLLCLVRKPIKI